MTVKVFSKELYYKSMIEAYLSSAHSNEEIMLKLDIMSQYIKEAKSFAEALDMVSVEEIHRLSAFMIHDDWCDNVDDKYTRRLSPMYHNPFRE